ncbi:type II methionyl aminopeptidase [Candidatus Pacearchaeota archaeon]|nr:type II methionyl aminopeptidase [Candidatus Pacearchaeota archaeon]
MQLDKSKILQAGKIASEAREFARGFIKKGAPLLEIADKIENKMIELGGKPAFPTCLSINEIAAHSTPSHDDKRIAEGILKIDMGVHIDGWIADTAFSIDLENDGENKKLIIASEKALESAIKTAKKSVKLSEMGKSIYNEINSLGLSPIINLSGHGISRYELHARVSIPNFDNSGKEILEEGLYAIEPFATSGNGRVHDGKPSGIYRLESEKNVRSPIAREVLKFIIEEYKTLPFCSRWLVKNLGIRALIGLKHLEENGNLHSYAELIESSGKNVSQNEHTILVEKDSVIVTTK